MQHITTTDGISYIKTFRSDEGNDLGLEVDSLYYYNITPGKYTLSSRNLVDVLNDAVATHEIPKSRAKENDEPSWSRHSDDYDPEYIGLDLE